VIGGLRSAAREVERLGQTVRTDFAVLDTVGRQAADRLRSELARPKVLLAIFAAGLGFGWLRGAPRTGRGARAEGEGGAPPARLAELAAVVIAGARLVEQIRRAAEAVAPAVSRSAAAPADAASSDAESL